MAQDIINENQNISYTNLDFSSIYTEVLDMVKQLTKKWDPSISDESDPGVILVKLSALIADKMNYNIDKNILEAFPLSVTQDSNARQLYEQLGYYMSWYKAATVPVTLSWKTTTLNENGEPIAYTIPKFTTITDENETVVYSLVGTEGVNDIVVSDGILYTDSSKNLNMVAYEGIPTQYTFNDRTTITPNMVDNNNRLYLSSAYVFENGIFINNVGQNNYAEWHRVNNLYEYSYNVHRYKFGYDSVSNLCYLEFPDNYAELFGSGIEIVYLSFSTDESYSDVPRQFLSKFLATITVGENNDVILNAENTSISNTEAAVGHAEKEGINEAYSNYKKTVGTFKTLITLRDYLNYITSKDVDVCSNAIVTDRTNDIQSTYKIINQHDGVKSLITEVEKSTEDFQFVKTSDEDVINTKTYYTFNSGSFDVVNNPVVGDLNTYYELQGEDVLSPFSLKFYLMQKSIALTSRGAYDDTFTMTSEDVDIDTLLEDTSHLVHTFEDIKPIGEGTFIKTEDTSITMNSAGVPNKIYYNYNPIISRYEPVPVAQLSYQAFNPREMKLFEKDIYYTQSTDNQWYSTTEYYYLDERIAPAIYRLYTITGSENLPPRSFNFSYAEGFSSNIYNKRVEYIRTEDTQINATKAKNHQYFAYENGSYVVADIPYPFSVDTTITGSFTVTTDLYKLIDKLNEIDSEFMTGESAGLAQFEYYTPEGSSENVWRLVCRSILQESNITTEALGTTFGVVIEGNINTADSIQFEFANAVDTINPKAAGLYEQTEEPMLSHIVFLKNKYPISMSIATYNTVDSTVRAEILLNIINAFYNNLDSSNIDFGDNISLDYLTQIAINSDTRIKNVSFDALTYSTSAIYWDEHQKSFIEITLPSSSEEVGYNQIALLPTYDNVIAYLFSKEIICKSILAGTTQLLVPDDIFAYHLNQQFLNLIPNVKYITGEATIDINKQDGYYVISQTENPKIIK